MDVRSEMAGSKLESFFLNRFRLCERVLFHWKSARQGETDEMVLQLDRILCLLFRFTLDDVCNKMSVFKVRTGFIYLFGCEFECLRMEQNCYFYKMCFTSPRNGNLLSSTVVVVAVSTKFQLTDISSSFSDFSKCSVNSAKLQTNDGIFVEIKTPNKQQQREREREKNRQTNMTSLFLKLCCLKFHFVYFES